MLLSEEGVDKERSPEEYKSIWKKYLALPQIKQDILTDSQMPQRIQRLQMQFRIDENTVGGISLFIRKIFFGELSLSEAEAKIGAMLMQSGGGDPNQAREITEFIEKEILTIQPKPQAEEAEETEYEEEKQKAAMTNLPLLQALSKYEQLGQQVITSEKIKLKTQIEPVRPSLINWLKYYRDELGIGQHSSVERGEFLFRSENGRKLSGEERERISLVLKSVEEHLPIAIDTQRQEIIFPASQGMTINTGRQSNAVLSNTTAGQPVFPSVAPSAQGRNAYFENQKPAPQKSSATPGSVSFSAGHIFPSEKESSQGETRRQVTGSTPQTSPQTSSFYIRPMSRGKNGES